MNQRFPREGFLLAVAAFLLFCHEATALSRQHVLMNRVLRIQSHVTLGQRNRIRRHMVADAPDAVVEQVSTQTVLDEILDESLRYSPRRPIIMEFDPASKAVSTFYFKLYFVVAISHTFLLFTDPTDLEALERHCNCRNMAASSETCNLGSRSLFLFPKISQRQKLSWRLQRALAADINSDNLYAVVLCQSDLLTLANLLDD